MEQRCIAILAVAIGLFALAAPAAAQFPTTTYGWNLGNTLEPPSGEGTWNNPPVSQAMINAVADAGFNTIRLPVAWDSHANQSTYQIDPNWLTRVQQVVDWSLAADLTVVLNTHWDGGWLENNITSSVNPTINAKMDAYWTQIANTFVDYDDRLLFAGANEPNVENFSEMATLNTYHETFISAVRETGGNNASRWLVVQGPYTDINRTDQWMNTLPDDPTEDRLVVEVHYYDPWQFAGLEQDASWGDAFYFWGDDFNSTALPGRNATHSEEDWLLGQLQKMHDKFVSQGVPVLLGEFGAMNRTGNRALTGEELERHLASREYYHQLIVDTANSLGIAPIYWDNGVLGQNGSGIFHRSSATIYDQGTVDALTGGPGSPADLDGDGDVDGHDFLLIQRDDPALLANWLTDYGNTPTPIASASQVPEPTAVVSWMVGILIMAEWRRSRNFCTSL